MLVPRQTQLAQAPALRCFHLWSKMAPGLALLGQAELKIWAQKFLKRLAQNYAVKVQAFALEDDRFHLVVQWAPQAVNQWSDEEATARWLAVHPPKGMPEPMGLMGPMDPMAPPPMDPMSAPGSDANAPAAHIPSPNEIRLKLSSLSMFMKQFKQQLAHRINRQFKRRGSIWQGRFHLAPLADAGAVAGAMAFVDLRAVVDSGGQRPEEQPFTGLHARVAIYKGAFGMPPYGPLGTPDGDMQVFPEEVTAELRQPEQGEPPPPLAPAEPGVLAGQLWGGMINPPWLPLRKYLHLLDNLVAQAKAWPHLPADAPGRAPAPQTPAWAGVVESLLTALDLGTASFQGQWARLATLRG